MNNESKAIFNLNGRVWIETADEKILGHGRVELLERIQASGSIRQAALQMKMSYKQAWDLVNHMNDRFGQPLVVSYRGGKGGGKAIVTEHGLKIINEFHLLQQKLQAFLKENTQNLTF
ncbi:MAG: winged helix-turn-helix domain-containing protein [Mucilaginibacter sp.]|uniref:winged helix-turn-helix domain-containing protein n=1 Tax=Mucilaginibacter sp. TaxID=1882438 RepID=UPI0031AB4EC8